MRLGNLLENLGIFESTFFDGNIHYYYDHIDVKIYKNPSLQQVKAMLQKHDLRVALVWDNDGLDEYVWDARTINHDAFEGKFGMNCVGFIVQKDGILTNDFRLYPKAFTNKQSVIEDYEYEMQDILDSYIVKGIFGDNPKIGVSY